MKKEIPTCLQIICHETSGGTLSVDTTDFMKPVHLPESMNGTFKTEVNFKRMENELSLII